MLRAVGVKFKNNPKIFDFLDSEEKLEIGDVVIVETAFGKEAGTLAYVNKKIKKNENLASVLRKATLKDLENQKKFEEETPHLEKLFKDCVKKHNLEMKLVDIQFPFEEGKVIFSFFSENRIDFRELVKDLVRLTKKQVRLKQVGPRDEARFLGGLGQCGRSLCCRDFLGTTESVTMDMARDQNIASKGSTKISGLCGRLMCCLAFEDNFYKEQAKGMPKIGEKIRTKKGIGKIIEVELAKKKVKVALEDGSKTEVNF